MSISTPETHDWLWSHAGLAAMAVSPSDPGAYSHSPLGDDIGLHIHSFEPDYVHVVVGGRKVAEVGPHRTRLYNVATERQAEVRGKLPL